MKEIYLHDSISTSYFGGFSPNDGTVDFYLRVGSLGGSQKSVLDLGAGRGAWFEDDHCEVRRSVRDIRSKFGTVLGADVDKIVFENRSLTEAALIENGRLPFKDSSFDVISCDFVLEHIEDVPQFSSEVDRVLKPGGWFCARTPHYYNYVAMASRHVPQTLESGLLQRVQPGRKEHDVFPKFYRLNTIRSIANAFPSYINESFIYRTEPSYFFGSRHVFRLLSSLHTIFPAALSGNIFVFLGKPKRD